MRGSRVNRKTVRTALVAGAAVGAVLLSASSCESESTAEKAAKARSKGVDQIRVNQPVKPMEYSPTLNTITKWSETWGKKGKVSYVYMQRADGSFAGYYVLEGLPVNYCVSGSPPYDMEDLPGDQDSADQKVDAPGLDGAYYGGCDSSRYYGFDAVTGQYVEYSEGMSLTAVLSDQPLPMDKQPRPFVSSIEDVK
jgi:hypothetical protein